MGVLTALVGEMLCATDSIDFSDKEQELFWNSLTHAAFF